VTVLERVTKLVISISSFEMNKNAQHGPSTKLAKRLKTYTVYLILCCTNWYPHEKRCVPELENLLYSNAFTSDKLRFIIMYILSYSRYYS